MNEAREIEGVLEFWFGACGPDGAIDPTRRRMWFKDGKLHDAEIRSRFGELHARASRGALDEWAKTARGRLALIVILDQFSRHIHRGTPQAFAQDQAAQRLALAGINDDVDLQLAPAQRAFFYLPFEHAEDLSLQERGVRRHERLVAAVTDEWRKDYESFLDFQQRHRDIIKRFGRFPHRNSILGRPSTPEEIEFLQQPGSSF